GRGPHRAGADAGHRPGAAAARHPDPLGQPGHRRRARAGARGRSPDPDVMHRRPRPRGEGVITRSMWIGIFYVGAIFAAGTLLVLDASLPGGLIEGDRSPRHAQTLAFTTL